MRIRNIVLVCYMVGWAGAAIITAWKTGSVPGELWTGPGIGLGAVMALFKDEDEDPATDTSAKEELPS